MAYVGRVVNGVLLWFESPRRLDQQKQDPHSSCGSCNKKYKQKKGKKYCTRRCKETAHKIRNKVKKKGPSSSETRGVKKALEEVPASPLGQALSSIKAAPVVAAPAKEPPKKTFVERVAEHLPTPTVVESVKDQPAPKAVVPTWEALCSDANELGVDLEAEPKNGQNFYIALLMARRAHHYEEWKRLIKSQDCRIRQYPETYIALKGVSGIGAVAAARALKARMNM